MQTTMQTQEFFQLCYSKNLSDNSKKKKFIFSEKFNL